MLWIAIFGFVVAVIVTGALWWLGAWNPPKSKDMVSSYPVFQRLPKLIHVAHRGGSLMGPENTMETYKRAVNEFGVNVLEFDLHLTSDGHVVLMHEKNVEATTNGVGLIEQMRLDRILELDAAYWYTEDGGFTYPLRGTGIKVPTLKSLLDEFAVNDNLVFFLDFKSMNAVQPALQIILDRGLEKKVILGAVFPKVNQEVLKYRHSASPVVADALTMLKLFFLYHLGLLWLYPLQHQVVGFIAIKRLQKLLSKGLIRSLRATGSKVALFGPLINSEENIQYYVDMGVNMVVTDRPNVMRKWLDSKSL